MSNDYCDACTAVAQQLIDILENRRCEQTTTELESNESRILFGTVEEVLSRDACPSCRQLQAEMNRWEAEYDWPKPGRHLIQILDDPSPSRPIYIRASDPGSPEKEHILMNLFFSEPAGPYDTWGRTFDAHMIDMGLIDGWMECCAKTHTRHCSARIADQLHPADLSGQILLYDAQDQCLRYRPLQDTKYMALSYVWGQVNTFRTVLRDLDNLMEPGSIRCDNQDLAIPQTIRDTMRLARRLGIRYLWVDSLCIVQDGPHKMEDLDRMAGIYASAYLVVISDGPDANFGLLGIDDDAKPRNRPCRPLHLPGITCLMDDHRIPPKRPRTWSKRGWTFQEALFSGRVLNFDIEGTVLWRCPTATWYEKMVLPTESLKWAEDHPTERSGDWLYFGFSELNFSWPDMRRWCVIAEQYYERELTFDYDAHNALAGTISVVSQTCPGGFIWGLPEYFLDIYLLWDLYWSVESGPPRRRDCREIPSWSFLGWKGGSLDTFWWRFSMDYTFIDDMTDGYGRDVAVWPVVEWQAKDEESGELRPIQNHYYLGRGRATEEPPPPGWNKHRIAETGEYYFTHDSVGEDTAFAYPILLPSDRGPPTRSQNSSHLHFRTKRSTLRLGTEPWARHRAFGARQASLVDDSGQWAGEIRLPISESMAKDEPLDRRVELIAVAEGQVRNDSFPKEYPRYIRYIIPPLPEWEREDRPKDGEVYEFYFVLWIEWDDGVAYRKALGRVDKRAWSKLPLEEIDVVLG